MENNYTPEEYKKLIHQHWNKMSGKQISIALKNYLELKRKPLELSINDFKGEL